MKAGWRGTTQSLNPNPAWHLCLPCPAQAFWIAGCEFKLGCMVFWVEWLPWASGCAQRRDTPASRGSSGQAPFTAGDEPAWAWQIFCVLKIAVFKDVFAQILFNFYLFTCVFSLLGFFFPKTTSIVSSPLHSFFLCLVNGTRYGGIVFKQWVITG